MRERRWGSVMSTYAKGRVFLSDAVDGFGQRSQIIDVAGIGIDGIGQGPWLSPPFTLLEDRCMHGTTGRGGMKGVLLSSPRFTAPKCHPLPLASPSSSEQKTYLTRHLIPLVEERSNLGRWGKRAIEREK